MMFGSAAIFNTNEIQSQAGKVILITGGNKGLGKETAIQLAKHEPAVIYISSRSQAKGDAAVAEIKAAVPTANIHILPLDLSSLASVRNAAALFLNSSSRLDVLINNAGIMAVPSAITTDGYEIQFGTNHLGHFLLTKLLLPTLVATAKLPNTDVRVVTLSSDAHSFSTPSGGIKFATLCSAQEEESRLAKYGQSKLANILHSRELARLYPQFTCVSIHPGMVATGLGEGSKDQWLFGIAKMIVRPFIGVDIQHGALNQLWAATGKEVESGAYYIPYMTKHTGTAASNDMDLASKLWEWSEKEVEKHVL